MEKLLEIIEGIKKNNILLPHFQREFVWNKTQQKKLILSVLTNLPASSSLLLKKSKKDDFKCLKIGMRNQEIKSFGTGDCWYLLDGQQRFSTIFYAFCNIFDSDKKENLAEFKKLDNKLCKRWHLNFNYDKMYLFNYDSLLFDQKNANELLPEDLESFLNFDEINEKNIKEHDVDLSSIEKNSKDNKSIPLIFLLINYKVQCKRTLKKIFDDRLDEIRSNNHHRNILFNILKNKSYPDLVQSIDKYYQKDEETIREIDQFIDKDCGLKDEWVDGVYDHLTNYLKEYRIQPIKMKDRNKAVKTFEYINTGGTNLSAFDLLCSKVGGFDLRKKVIEKTKQEFDFFDKKFDSTKIGLVEEFGLVEGSANFSVTKKYADYLSQVLNLIHFKAQGKSPNDKAFSTILLKSKYSLNHLDGEFIIKHYEEAVNVIKKTSAILQLFCGHKEVKNITNHLSLIQIFTFFIYAKEPQINKNNIEKLIGLFWLKLFVGNYNSNQNENSINDTASMYQLIFNSSKDVLRELRELINKSLFNTESFATKELLTSKKCSNSLENNIFMFIKSKKEPFYDLNDPTNPHKINLHDEIEIHHLIPLGDATNIKQSSGKIRKDKDHLLNSTMNKTPIRKETNRIIGNKSIDRYSTDLEMYTLQFSHHSITKEWSIKYNKQNIKKIKGLFESRFDKIKENILETVQAVLN